MSLLNLLISKSIMYVPGSVVHIFSKKYIAGEKLIDAVKSVETLNKKGMMSTIDILGEEVKTEHDAIFYKNFYIDVLNHIEKEHLDANISLKPTQLGLSIKQELALDNITEVIKHAKKLNNFVRIDMENCPYTDDILQIYLDLKKEYDNVGIVLQSYLRRTISDIEQLPKNGLNVRLCKGVYNEARMLAYKDPSIINKNYLYALEKLFELKAYVGIATHDEKLIFESMRLIDKYNLNTDNYEFQMLLGVDENLRDMILNAGHKLRTYVPFGKEWLSYSKRRLKENPNIARHALRQLFDIHGD